MCGHWMSMLGKALLASLIALVTASAGPPSREPVLSPRDVQRLCGPLCLTFCARWLGVVADLDQVARDAGSDPTAGTSLAGLLKASGKLGLEGRAYRLRLGDLSRVTSKTPGIAHMDGSHFVVVWMDEPDQVTVVQPPVGVRRMSLSAFGRRWNGAILVVSRPGEQPRWSAARAWWAVGVGVLLLLVLGGMAAARAGGRRGSRH
jgi:ABC-type bacteriocin/lantibiotic exporter with double-glycine peptidase domain